MKERQLSLGERPLLQSFLPLGETHLHVTVGCFTALSGERAVSHQ